MKQETLVGERDYNSSDFRRRFDSEPLPSAFLTLAKSAHAVIGENGNKVALVPHTGELDKDGCDFIAACYFYLSAIGCPPSAIDFVVCLAGISGGKFDDDIELTDVIISGVMNCTKGTVQNKRKTLKSWMQRENYAVIEITEGEYNHELKKNAPTRYKILMTPIASRIVLLARSGNLWKPDDPREQQKAIKEAAVDTAWQTPEAPTPVKERKKKKAKSPTKEIATKRKTILNCLQKMLRLEYHRGHDPSALWEELRFDMNALAEDEIETMTATGGVF